jgi:hypothetical protein
MCLGILGIPQRQFSDRIPSVRLDSLAKCNLAQAQASFTSRKETMSNIEHRYYRLFAYILSYLTQGQLPMVQGKTRFQT